MKIKGPDEKDLEHYLVRKYLQEELNKQLDTKKEARALKLKQRLMQITPQIFFEFLNEKGVSLSCPSCGAEKLSVPERFKMQTEMLASSPTSEKTDSDSPINTAFSNPYVAYTTFSGEEDIRSLRASYYPVHCQNCGNLSLYRSATVLNWFDDKKKDEGEQG